jgi:secreted Zn-dependent insulinase-like peptidase
MWNTEEFLSYIKVNPLNFIAYFIERNGKNTLVNYLKKKMWISNLTCSIDDNTNFSLF